MALNSLFCADVPLSNYSLTQPCFMLSHQSNLIAKSECDVTDVILLLAMTLLTVALYLLVYCLFSRC